MSMETKQTGIARSTVVVLLVLTVGVVYWYTSKELHSFQTHVQMNVETSEANLIALAETTGNARIDKVAETVIIDCSNRFTYETLLSRLDSLSQAELEQVDSLYDACSWQPPMVRALMAHRLEVALAEFETHLSLFENLDGSQHEAYNLSGWQSLVAKEKTRADLLHQQNVIQGRIIDTLVAGEHEQIPGLLQEAQSINGTLNVTSIQINQERAALTEG